MTDAEITQQYLAPFYLDYLNSQRAGMLDPDSESGLHTHYQHLEDEQKHTAAH